ncbi:MAG: MarR family transcriptional regulator [Pseudonocardia sediminis]
MSEPALDPDELAERLAEIYLVVGPLYRRVLRLVERDGAEDGVPAGLRAVLDLLRRNGPMTVPQMGRAQSLSRQFVQRTVNDALGSGLVELVDNPAHRRSRLVALTGEGQERIDAVVRREHAQLREVGGDIGAADVDACMKVLTRMLAALDEVE